MPLVLIFFGQLTWSLNVFCFMSLDCLWFCQKHAFASTPLQILRVWSVYATEGYALGIDSVKSLCLWCSCQMNFLMGTIELCPRMKDRPDERPPLFQDHFWLLVTFFPSNFDVNKLLTKHHPSVQTTTFFFSFFLWWCYQGPSLCPVHLLYFYIFIVVVLQKRGTTVFYRLFSRQLVTVPSKLCTSLCRPGAELLASFVKLKAFHIFKWWP